MGERRLEDIILACNQTASFSKAVFDSHENPLVSVHHIDWSILELLTSMMCKMYGVWSVHIHTLYLFAKQQGLKSVKSEWHMNSQKRVTVYIAPLAVQLFFIFAQMGALIFLTTFFSFFHTMYFDILSPSANGKTCG